MGRFDGQGAGVAEILATDANFRAARIGVANQGLGQTVEKGAFAGHARERMEQFNGENSSFGVEIGVVARNLKGDLSVLVVVGKGDGFAQGAGARVGSRAHMIEIGAAVRMGLRGANCAKERAERQLLRYKFHDLFFGMLGNRRERGALR